MFRLPFLVALSLLTAFGLGIGSAVEMLNASSGFGAIRLGAWAAFPDAQTAAADPYAKSHRARAGKLLYGAAEGLTFSADSDDSGASLDPACTYRIEGLTPPARFWTLYAATPAMDMLEPGPGLPSSFNAWTVLRHSDGTFTITVSPTAQPGNWLAIDGRKQFRIVLTLFDTPTAGSSGVLELRMPGLTRVGCA